MILGVSSCSGCCWAHSLVGRGASGCASRSCLHAVSLRCATLFSLTRAAIFRACASCMAACFSTIHSCSCSTSRARCSAYRVNVVCHMRFILLLSTSNVQCGCCKVDTKGVKIHIFFSFQKNKHQRRCNDYFDSQIASLVPAWLLGLPQPSLTAPPATKQSQYVFSKLCYLLSCVFLLL